METLYKASKADWVAATSRRKVWADEWRLFGKVGFISMQGIHQTFTS